MTPAGGIAAIPTGGPASVTVSSVDDRGVGQFGAGLCELRSPALDVTYPVVAQRQNGGIEYHPFCDDGCRDEWSVEQ